MPARDTQPTLGDCEVPAQSSSSNKICVCSRISLPLYLSLTDSEASGQSQATSSLLCHVPIDANCKEEPAQMEGQLSNWLHAGNGARKSSLRRQAASVYTRNQHHTQKITSKT